MTVKKYQFYIDTKKQEEFYEEKNTAKYVNVFSPEYADMAVLLGYEKKFFLTVKEITVNSGNKIVKELFEKNKIPANNFYYVYRNYKKVKIYFWDICQESELPQNTDIASENTKLLRNTTKKLIDEKNNLEIFFMVVITNKMLDDIKKNVSIDALTPYKDLFFTQKINKDSSNIDEFSTKLKYKLYLNDRLLIERFFPEDLRVDKSVVEEVYLDVKQPNQLKLVTDSDLYIVKIIQNDKTFYPNSKEFILEP